MSIASMFSASSVPVMPTELRMAPGESDARVTRRLESVTA
jgi:hypothetical protein